MNNHEYAIFVGSLIKPGKVIKDECSADQMHLLHMVLGIVGEAGELADAIKKHVVYQKPLDIENIIEEMGDIEFYMEGLRAALLILREMTLAANHRKLVDKKTGRYASGKYSDAAAIARLDKEVGRVTEIDINDLGKFQKSI